MMARGRSSSGRARSAKTGRYVTRKDAARHKSTTVVERLRKRRKSGK
jgi:hypothetical protein